MDKELWLALKYIEFGGYYPIGVFDARGLAFVACNKENKKYNDDKTLILDFEEGKNDIWICNTEFYTYVVRLIHVNKVIEL